MKHDIDSGRTGDKVAGLDPAAAPLGTDEEAGGAPLQPHLIAEARIQERAARPANPTPSAASPDLAPDGRSEPRLRLPPFLLGVGVAVLLAAAMLAVFAVL